MRTLEHYFSVWKKYIVLATFALACLLIASATVSDPTTGGKIVNSLFSDLAAGFIGAILIGIFLEKGIDDRKRDEEQKIRNIAFNKIESNLIFHIKCLYGANKRTAHINMKTHKIPTSVHEIFDTEYFDFHYILDSLTGYEYIFSEDIEAIPELINSVIETDVFMRSTLYHDLMGFYFGFEQIIETYSNHLDAQIIEKLNFYANQPHLRKALELSQLKRLFPKQDSMSTMNDEVRDGMHSSLERVVSDFNSSLSDHILLLLSFVQYINSINEKQITIQNIVTDS